MDSAELREIPLQSLLALEVGSASTYPEKIHHAPSSAVIITAQEIHTHAYRTLADVLRRMRGLYVTHHRSWGYLGVRGFPRASINGQDTIRQNGRLFRMKPDYRLQT